MRILELMRQHGITQDMLAQQLGVTKQAVNNIIKKDNPNLSTVERIAVAIGVPVYELFVDPKSLVHCEGPAIDVDCPHCGAQLHVSVPVEVKG